MKYNSKYKWNQNEIDALVSFAYNIGSIDALTANGTRSRATIAAKMLQYNKAGGKVLNGLTRRRKAERELFLTAVKKKAAKKKNVCNSKYEERSSYDQEHCKCEIKRAWKDSERN